ncbi:MAG: hypothetical protein DRJ13_18105, partial [Bacteroidetes bacterium]
ANLENAEAAEKIVYNLLTIQKEILDEHSERMIMHDYLEATPTFTMKYLDQLTPELINPEILAYTEKYLDALKDFYLRTYKAAVNKIDETTLSFDLEKLQDLKRKHANKTLDEFVTNKKTFDYFTEYNNDIIQLRDPIYQDPTNKFIKAHFYAPRKMIAGTFVSTLWVNVMVIWFMTLILYILLYFRVFKKFLDYIEQNTQKNPH